MANPTSGIAATRLFFVDHLRVALTTLVVVHHVSIIYAADFPFYYLEPDYHYILQILLLVMFQLVNQAYFMGFFFLISGYFTPGSFDRKGPVSYLKGRLLRLGIPTIIYMFILSPIAAIGFYQLPASLTGITTPLTWQQYPKLVGIGPMWFAIMLLVFEFSYVAWRIATKKTGRRIQQLPPIP